MHSVQRTLETGRQYRIGCPGCVPLRWICASSDLGRPDEASWNNFMRDIEAAIDQLGLSDPLVVAPSLGGMLAMAYALRHRDCPGVVNIDGFDFRQRGLFDQLGPSVVDAFLDDFRAGPASFVPIGVVDIYIYIARKPAGVDPAGQRDVEDPGRGGVADA